MRIWCMHNASAIGRWHFERGHSALLSLPVPLTLTGSPPPQVYN